MVPACIAVSIGIHAGVFAGVVRLLEHVGGTSGAPTVAAPDTHRAPERLHFVFIATTSNSQISPRGGGGGGNRQPGPIRRAQGVGSDAMTLRVAKPLEVTATPADRASLPGVLLDAKPLASGTFDQIGLPSGGEPSGLSTGSGSGGGVGTGFGTGIGPGNGPGIGPGSGGGAGGGAYRPGAGVSSPRVIRQVKPTYTAAALAEKIQGTVIMELVVTRDGRPAQIRVVRSLDPSGLDAQALLAVSEWRFEPGRLAGTPVDVLVTVAMDFWIQ
jgi:periplasmic protein TonB